jgi:hypothetical protein
MGQLLGYGKKGPDGRVAEPLPHQNAKCLACHSVVDSVNQNPDAREQALSEGVGCGGCHGPSEKWAAAHVAPGWKALSNEQKWKQYGFVPTKNLVARALNCASCHVGDGERDMNHDMIAAGHPRLAFEPASFHASGNYRKHWAERGSARDFEVRVWAVGKVATLRAAVNLLYERATAPRRPTPGGRAPRRPVAGVQRVQLLRLPPDHRRPELRGAQTRDRRGRRQAGPRAAGLGGVGEHRGGCGGRGLRAGVPRSKLSRYQVAEAGRAARADEPKRAPDPAEVARRALAARANWTAAAQLQAAADRNPGAVPAGAPRTILDRLARGRCPGTGWPTTTGTRWPRRTWGRCRCTPRPAGTPGRTPAGPGRYRT